MKLQQIIESDFENGPYTSKAHRIYIESQKLDATLKEINYYTSYSAHLRNKIIRSLLAQGLTITWGDDNRTITHPLPNTNAEIDAYNKIAGKIVTKLRKLNAIKLTTQQTLSVLDAAGI
jgi:hypothetical protein